MIKSWIIFAIIMLICLSQSPADEQKKRQCIKIVTFILVFFSGLRSWWYGDLIKYYTRFLSEANVSLLETLSEYGYRNFGLSIVYKISYLIFGKYGYTVDIFLIALFSAVTLAVVIGEFSPSPYWSYLMYLCMGFYIFTLSGLKQTIAMGFCCLAFVQLMHCNLKKFLIFVGLGALFHTPALLFVLAYPFSKKKVDKTFFLFVVLLIGLVFMFRNQIGYYLEDGYNTESSAIAVLNSSAVGVGGRFIFMVLILILAALLRTPGGNDVVYNKVYILMVIAAAIQTMSVFNNSYTRLADYYYQFVVIFVPLFMQPIRSEADLQYRSPGIIGQGYGTYTLLAIVITIFSVWFYSTQIGEVDALGEFVFFWQNNGYSLYGG